MVHLAIAGPVTNRGPTADRPRPSYQPRYQLENTIDNRGSLEYEVNQTKGDTIVNIKINKVKGKAMSANKKKYYFNNC
jgi:hypothetical protein